MAHARDGPAHTAVAGFDGLRQAPALIRLFRSGRIHTHVFATRSQCLAQRNQRAASCRRLCGNPSRKAGCAQGFYALRVLGFHRFPGVLRDLSHPREAIGPLSRAGMDKAGLLRAADFAYDPGDRDCAVDFDYDTPRLDGEIRQTPADCAVDAAAMVLCLRHGRHRLFDGLPNLRGEEQLRLGDIAAQKSARIGENYPAGTPGAPTLLSRTNGWPGACRTWEIRCARSRCWD